LKNIIDLVYERNINIYISSEYTLDNIFDDLVIKHIKLHRTISRLKEMVTKGYREDTGKERRRVFIRDSLELLTEIDTELKENKIKK
jgi:predicted ATPase